MSTVRILESDARPQGASPLFSRLPIELRLLIYKFAFLSSYATTWFNHEFCRAQDDHDEGDGKRVRGFVLSSAGAQMPKYKRFRTGQICFSHSSRDSFSHPSRGSGFSLFLACRMMYVEAFSIYWGAVALEVARAPRTAGGCGLLAVCNYLPAAIKENLCHLRNIRLPIMGPFQSAPGDETWTPTLLLQFPKLATLEFTDVDLFGQEPWDAIGGLLADPDGDDYPYNTFRVRPFRLLTGESPAEFIERKIGVQRSSGVTIISRRELPKDYSSPFTCEWDITRRQYLNWTTGMVYQIVGAGLIRALAAFAAEDGYMRIIRPRQGFELDRDYD